MKYPFLNRLGFGLLQTLHALLEERHVTRAAKRCFLSQPAMSRVLERFRDAVEDDLLVRRGVKYERTPRAERLFLDLNSLLPQMESALRGSQFDPKSSEERYRLAMTDYACAVILPQLLKLFSKSSPKSRLDVLPWHQDCFEDLAAGRLDMVVTVAGLGRPPEFVSEALFNEKFVCVLANDHPFKAKKLTLKKYLKFRHIVVNVSQGQQSLVDRPLDHNSQKREVGASLPFFTPAMLLAANSDMIFTAPSRLIEAVGRTSKVRVVKAPHEIPSFKYEMVWHPRMTNDSAQQWLRDQLRKACILMADAKGLDAE